MTERQHVRVGVVGARGRGLSLARLWRLVEPVRLVAIADPAPDAAAAAARELGDVATYADHREMLARERLDVVAIGSEASTHAVATIDAARLGARAVLCEKPMATSLAECDAMVEACRASGTLLSIAHPRRWNPVHRAIRHAIASGAIGRPTHAYLTTATGRVGREGTHFWDALCYLLDDRVVAVNGRLDRTRTSQHETFGPDMVADPGPLGVLTFSRGTRLSVDAFNDVMVPLTYVIFGTRGRIELREADRPDPPHHTIDYWARDEDRSDPQFGRTPLARRELSVRDPTESSPPPEIAAHPDYVTIRGLLDVVRCLETGEQPASTGDDGRHAMEVIVAFHLSDRAGMQSVSLPIAGEARELRLAIR